MQPPPGFAQDPPSAAPEVGWPQSHGRQWDDQEWHDQDWEDQATSSWTTTWPDRVLELAWEAKIGLSLSNLVWAWQARWPRDNIEDWKPCKKSKDAVQKHVSGVIIVNDSIFVCQEAGRDDPIYREIPVAQEARDMAARVKAMSKEERNHIRESFQDGRVPSWTCSYESIGNGDDVFYRCTLSTIFPPDRASGGSPLAGPWCYRVDNDYYSFSVSEQLCYSEADPEGRVVVGELQEAQDGWWEARTHTEGRKGPSVRLRLIKDANHLEVQSRAYGSPHWCDSVLARKSLRCTFGGYGLGPGMSAVAAMERALQDPRMPAAAPRAPPKRSSSRPLAPPAPAADDAFLPRFQAAEKRLEKLLEAMVSLRSRIKEAGDPGADELDGREDDMEQRQELLGQVGSLLDELVDEVCGMLAGDDPVPLTDPRWQMSKLLSFVWQYTLAVFDKSTLKKIGQAVRVARDRLAAPPSGACPAGESLARGHLGGDAMSGSPTSSPPPESEPAEQPDVGMPFSMWEDLIEWSARVAHLDPLDQPTGMAEEGLAALPATLPAAEMRYSAHFLHLLHHERASELRQEYSKEKEAAAPPFLEFQGSWGSQAQHRPDVELTLNNESLRKRGGGLFIRKGDLALLMPWPASHWGQSLPVELRTEFDCSLKDPDAIEEKQRVVKLKHWSVTLPAGELSSLFRATTFALVPLRSSRVTHVRQAEAVRSLARETGGSIHPALRGMVLESWRAANGMASSSGCRASPLADAPPLASSASSAPEELVQRRTPASLAAERPEDLPPADPSSSSSSSQSGPAIGCGIPLTSMQQRAVAEASSRRCTLIRGPPGTGKTHTACAIVERWMDALEGCRILVVTQSNAAALNIHERLEKFNLPSVRIGMQMKPDDLLGQRHFQTFFDAKEELQPLRDAAARDDEIHTSVSIPLLQKAARLSQIVVMTCISSGNMSLINSSFQRVLLDEAAQATEPTTLVPLMTGAAAFACVGDDRQLPATILSRAAKLQGLDESLFERFLRSDVCIEGSGFVQLDVQRRMHSSIAQFPSGHFYAGSVSNGCNDKDRPPIPGLRWPNDGNSRVLFVDCSDHGAREEQCGTSIRNFGEAELLVKTLVHLFSAGDRSGCTLRPAEVACITGYAAQRELLKRAAQHLLRSRESVRVDTVDGFQGMERELVLVSSTRANETGEVGFMRDRRRANVLLTRARRGLIVFGDYRTMRREPEVWAPWLDWVYRQGCYVTSRQLSQMLS